MQRTLLLNFAALITAWFLLPLCAVAEPSDQHPLLQSEGKPCPDHRYTVHLFSKDPLVIYISDFITVEEALHLEKITSVKYSSHI